MALRVIQKYYHFPFFTKALSLTPSLSLSLSQLLGNNHLCYMENINWGELFKSKTTQKTQILNNKKNNLCGKCYNFILFIIISIIFILIIIITRSWSILRTHSSLKLELSSV